MSRGGHAEGGRHCFLVREQVPGEIRKVKKRVAQVCTLLHVCARGFGFKGGVGVDRWDIWEVSGVKGFDDSPLVEDDGALDDGRVSKKRSAVL